MAFANAIVFHVDEVLQESPQDVNATAFKLRKNVIDTLLEYACNHENGTGCEKNNATVIDTRGRAINLQDSGGLDLVFVLDASSSVKESGFKLGMAFVKQLVKTIGASKRYVDVRLLATTGCSVHIIGEGSCQTVNNDFKVAKDTDHE